MTRGIAPNNRKNNGLSTSTYLSKYATKELNNKKIIGYSFRSYKLQPHSFFNKHF